VLQVQEGGDGLRLFRKTGNFSDILSAEHNTFPQMFYLLKIVKFFFKLKIKMAGVSAGQTVQTVIDTVTDLAGGECSASPRYANITGPASWSQFIPETIVWNIYVKT